MGARVSRTDFEWSYSEEPHASRRVQILKKYPEIKQLMGHEPKMLPAVCILVTIQMLSLYFVKDFSWPWVIVCSYCFGGIVNHALMLAIHEISHNLAFGHSRPMANRALGMFANIPIGVPMSVSFKKYHIEHHKYQGDDLKDTDIPSRLEAHLFNRTSTKVLWVFLQPIFYSFRPLLVYPKVPTTLEYVNLVLQLSFNVLLYSYWGAKPLVYLVIGSLLAMGLHPVAGHFISEHYMFLKGHETYSYYGLLNLLTFNVGYHNEHHDFPNIPWTRLPMVSQIAKEFYEPLPKHQSWCKVIYDYIMDPSIGPYARIKRKSRGL